KPRDGTIICQQSSGQLKIVLPKRCLDLSSEYCDFVLNKDLLFSLTSLMRHMYSFQLQQSAARLKRILVHCFCYESVVSTKLFSLRYKFLASGLYFRAALGVGR